MQLKEIITEDFNHYRVPAMVIATCFCDWKCCHELKRSPSLCQNSPLSKMDNIDIPDIEILKQYLSNNLTEAIVIAGLEPVLQSAEVLDLIKLFRDYGCFDTFVIYTGYNKDEIPDFLSELQQYGNIIVKFGRFKTGDKAHIDPVLGVELVSSNQYAEKIC
jgi:hypothetical protein